MNKNSVNFVNETDGFIIQMTNVNPKQRRRCTECSEAEGNCQEVSVMINTVPRLWTFNIS